MRLSIRRFPFYGPNLARKLMTRSFSQFDYSLRCMFPKWSDFDITYTRKGLIKKRIRQGLMYLTFVVSIIGLYKARKRDAGFTSVYDTLRQQARGLAIGLLKLLGVVIRSVQRRLE